MHTVIDDFRPEFEHVIEFFKADLSSLRTGRANAALVEDIPVEAYGSMMTVKGVGSVLVPDAKTIMIEPWDKALTKEIEKAVRHDAAIRRAPALSLQMTYRIGVARRPRNQNRRHRSPTA